MNLYDLTNDFLQLQAMLEDPDVDSQVITDTLESLQYDLKEKADGYAKVIKNMEANVTAIKQEKERLTAKQNLLESSIKRLKENLQVSMIATGNTKFKTDLFSFGIQKNGGKIPVILDVKDTSELPDELVRIKEENMGRNSETLYKPFDPEKLKAEFNKRNVTLGKASVALGHSPSYFGKIMESKRINDSCLLMLKHIYLIEYDAIKPDEEKPEQVSLESQEEVKETIDGIGKDEFFGNLYKCVYSAVYHALSKANSDERIRNGG